MRVFNTLSGKKEEFKPLNPGKVSMYVCGVTTYDYSHLGHARTYVSFDVIRRYLIHNGYSVRFIQNVTDVDDKIINRAKETGEDPLSLSAKFDSLSREDLSSLGILPADEYPKVTASIGKIIDLVSRLVKAGFAYQTSTGVYFETSKFKPYGKLSRQKPSKIKAGARVEIDEEKKNPADFALWKTSPKEELGFPSPFGRGRPGWHIECSAMSLSSLGDTLDIHGGARDLIFPHHENEIAQSQAATGKPFVKYWLHTGFLTVKGEKMAKSLGNFITIQDALKKYHAQSIRLFFIQTHYRSPIDFSESAIEGAKNALEGLHNTLQNAKEAIKAGSKARNPQLETEISSAYSSFLSSMDDDFDTPNALASLFKLSSLANSELAKQNPSRLANTELAKQSPSRLANSEAAKKNPSSPSPAAGPSSSSLSIAGSPSSPSLSLAVQKIEEILSIFSLLPEEKKLPLEKLQAFISSLGEKNPPKTPEKCMEKIISLREEARKSKNFALSDKIRADLAKIGITLEDSSGKTTCKIT